MFRQAMHMPTKGATMAEQTSKADRVKLNRELAQMLKGGVIMDVTTPEQARIAEEAGACAVMALRSELLPAGFRGGLQPMAALSVLSLQAYFLRQCV